MSRSYDNEYTHTYIGRDYYYDVYGGADQWEPGHIQLGTYHDAAVKVELHLGDHPINAAKTVWFAERDIYLPRHGSRVIDVIKDYVVVKIALGNHQTQDLLREGKIYKEKLNILQTPVAPKFLDCVDGWFAPYDDDELEEVAIMILQYCKPCDVVKKFVYSPCS
jgi:hypothetical protein